MDRGDTISVFGNHFRKIACVLRRRLATQPNDALIIGVDFDVSQRRHVLGRKLGLYLRRNNRIVHVSARMRGPTTIGYCPI
jgi:hypothetical protein